MLVGYAPITRAIAQSGDEANGQGGEGSVYVYLDESGATGLKFRGGGSSRHFTVALLLVDDPIPLHQAVHDLRLRLGLPETHEFKFGSTGHEYRLAFFHAIRPYAFEIRAWVIDKQRASPAPFAATPPMYEHLVSRILARERDALRDRTLVIDESVQGKVSQARLLTALRRALTANEPGGGRIVRDITIHRSHQDNLIQVADMAAGAVARGYERGDDRYLRLLGRKRTVLRYPDTEPGDPPR